jgi:hypothetical protein
MADEGQKEQVLPGQREDMLATGRSRISSSNLKYGTGSTRNELLDMSKKDHWSWIGSW